MKPKYGRPIRKLSNAEKETKVFKSLGMYLYDHAFTCFNQDCICRDSVFNDTIEGLRDISKDYKREVKSIWNRDKNEINRN